MKDHLAYKLGRLMGRAPFYNRKHIANMIAKLVRSARKNGGPAPVSVRATRTKLLQKLPRHP